MAGPEPFRAARRCPRRRRGDAQLFENPRALFVARRPQDVSRVLEEAEAARLASGGTLAGYLAYEAGLALEPKLAPLAASRSGAAGPLVWFGLFDAVTTIPAAQVPAWLAERAATAAPRSARWSRRFPPAPTSKRSTGCRKRSGPATSTRPTYTMMLAGAAHGDPLAIYRAVRPSALAGYGGVVFDGSHWLLSFSPELFFALKGREAKVKPMKGTRPRGADARAGRASPPSWPDRSRTRPRT
jgi:para-aminobenzoate synthetase / 4-amino-4-deoxychorismate lyase